MSPVVSGHMLRLAWSVPMALPVRPHWQPVLVMYHGVPASSGATISAAVFEQHVRFLKRHFDFAATDDAPAQAGSVRQRVLMTFDDGFRNNAEVVAPILRRHDVPAVFFVCSRHATPGRYLWFSHLEALERHFRWNGFSFRGRVYDMRPSARRRSMRRLRQTLLSLEPHPGRMYQALEEELPPLEEFVGAAERADCYAGMTAEQAGELAADPRFTLGVHTADHPFLSRCGTAEARRQLDANRRWIEDATGRRSEFVAYPSGDYDASVTDTCRELGFTKGFGVDTRSWSRSPLELTRLGIYAPSTDILGFKVRWGRTLRCARIPIG